MRDVLLNELKKQQQRAVEYKNTAASVAAQQVQKTLLYHFAARSHLPLFHCSSQAEAEQRSAEVDEAAVQQAEAAVSELRAAINAARVAHHAALTSHDVDDTMTASSMVTRPRRERDLAAAEARRLETEVEDVRKGSVTIEAALRVACSETAQLLEDAEHALHAHPALVLRRAEQTGAGASFQQANRYFEPSLLRVTRKTGGRRTSSTSAFRASIPGLQRSLKPGGRDR